MLKIEKDYLEKYGNIPNEQALRLDILIAKLKKKRKPEKVKIFDEVKRIGEIKWKTYQFIVYLVPKATPRPRINKATQLFYVLGSDVNKKLFRKFIEKNPHELIITPMKFHIDSYLPIPSTLSASESILAEMGYIRPISKPDFDNVAKTYADMIQGSLIYDDALIIEGISRKFYSIKPRIEITIEYMEEFDSLFNRKKIESKLEKMNQERNNKDE